MLTNTLVLWDWYSIAFCSLIFSDESSFAKTNETRLAIGLCLPTFFLTVRVNTGQQLSTNFEDNCETKELAQSK